MSAAAVIDPVARLSAEIGVSAEHVENGWFARLVLFYVKRWNETHAQQRAHEHHESPSVRAQSAIRRACILSSVTGASAGMVTTGATLFAAQTEGLGAIVGIPASVLAIGGEALFRAIVHVELTCELADIFSVKFDTDDPADFWRLYALIFKMKEHDEESSDPGRKLVHEISHVEGEEVGQEIGRKIMGESVVRNIVPVIGIFTSAITNYKLTRHLGDVVRRYMRYQRAMHDAFEREEHACADCFELVVEGVWFLFTADGKLSPEEAALLAHLLSRLDDTRRHAVMQRFVEDELEWTERIRHEVPEGVRDAFLHALEVAAAVDKEISLPERKILRRASHSLGREYDAARVETMIRDFEEDGVLATPGDLEHAPAAMG